MIFSRAFKKRCKKQTDPDKDRFVNVIAVTDITLYFDGIMTYILLFKGPSIYYEDPFFSIQIID